MYYGILPNFFSCYIFEIRCVFYIYNTSQFRPAIFKGLNSHMCLVATIWMAQVWTVQKTAFSYNTVKYRKQNLLFKNIFLL